MADVAFIWDKGRKRLVMSVLRRTLRIGNQRAVRTRGTSERD